jgi:hypothetical protein
MTGNCGAWWLMTNCTNFKIFAPITPHLLHAVKHSEIFLETFNRSGSLTLKEA